MTRQTSQAMNSEQDIGWRGAVWKVITSKAVVGIFGTQKLQPTISESPTSSNQGPGGDGDAFFGTFSL